MVDDKLTLLAKKYFNNTISQSEHRELEILISDKSNRNHFKELIKEEYQKNANEAYFKSMVSSKKINEILDKSESVKVFRLSSMLKYAAVILILISSTLFIKNQLSKNTISDKQEITLETHKPIKLFSENQLIKTFDKESVDSITNNLNSIIGHINFGNLKYYPNNTASSLYHTLEVPNGQKFNIELSDGTKIELNSGSTLVYPVTFKSNASRNVLLNGEAFFDVAKQEGSTFTVNANELNIEVLGTRFNVSSYNNENTVNTILEEGKVKVYLKNNKDDSIILDPNEEIVWYKDTKTLEKREAKLNIDIAWKNNELRFYKTYFSEIRKTLERYYDIEIVNNNKTLENQRFTGNFSNENIIQIMDYFAETNNFKYTVKDRIITVESK